MTAPFLALITPLTGSGAHPDNTLPQPQPPRPPLGIWGPTDPRPGYGLPGNQPYPDQGLPGNQPYPDQGLPGSQPRPDNTLPGGQGGRPSHPIYYPPYPDQGLPGSQPRPDQGLPGNQPYPDQGLPPFISHPIVLPPDLPEELPDPDGRPIDWKTAWTPQTGWIVVGIPQGPVPTPSQK